MIYTPAPLLQLGNRQGRLIGRWASPPVMDGACVCALRGQGRGGLALLLTGSEGAGWWTHSPVHRALRPRNKAFLRQKPHLLTSCTGPHFPAKLSHPEDKSPGCKADVSSSSWQLPGEPPCFQVGTAHPVNHTCWVPIDHHCLH